MDFKLTYLKNVLVWQVVTQTSPDELRFLFKIQQLQFEFDLVYVGGPTGCFSVGIFPNHRCFWASLYVGPTLWGSHCGAHFYKLQHLLSFPGTCSCHALFCFFCHLSNMCWLQQDIWKCCTFWSGSNVISWKHCWPMKMCNISYPTNMPLPCYFINHPQSKAYKENRHDKSVLFLSWLGGPFD